MPITRQPDGVDRDPPARNPHRQPGECEHEPVREIVDEPDQHRAVSVCRKCGAFISRRWAPGAWWQESQQTRIVRDPRSLLHDCKERGAMEALSRRHIVFDAERGWQMARHELWWDLNPEAAALVICLIAEMRGFKYDREGTAVQWQALDYLAALPQE